MLLIHFFTKIQDGGRRHLFKENLLPFLYYWANPHQIWWDRCESEVERNCSCQKRIITKFQDGRCRHLELRKILAISLLVDQSSPNLVEM